MSLPAEPILERWRALLAEAPTAPLVAEGAAVSWSTRVKVEAVREAWVQTFGERCRGRRVLFSAPNGAQWLGQLLAIWSCGGIAVPLDPLSREEERIRLCSALRPIAVIADSEIQWLDSATRMTASVVLGKLTSGSTGTPKALFFRVSELLADALQVEAAMGIGPGDINLAAIPFGHSYGLGNLVLPAIAFGRPVVCASAVYPRVLAQEAVRGGATVFPATPAILRAFLRVDSTVEAWPGLRLVISAGARLEPTVASAFRDRYGLVVCNFYGSSETGGIAFDPTGEAGFKGDFVGYVMPGVKVRLAASGRLEVVSPAVLSHRNRRRVAGRPAMLLGDLGRVDEQGRVCLRGRTDGLLKLGARRLSRSEIEAALRSVEGVEDCVVRLVPSAEGELLGALVAGQIERKLVRSRARELLAAWKVPKRMRIVEEIPVNARGKVDRAAVLAMLQES